MALGEAKPPVPVCIEVDEAQEKDRIVEILERVYGKWPGPIIFVVNTRMIKQAPKYNALDKCLEDYRVPPPDMRKMFSLTQDMHIHYDPYKTGLISAV